ncbi:MAG TPA: DUF86 domain-containing protein [Phototrophicaceae bacterium]|nr:DUF86 domain-containing protein [Phototrophicaceae bacterium]
MNERDETRLRDMLDAAHKARSFAEGKTRRELDHDEMFAFALVRALEIIGEAASKVSQETRGSYPEVRWTEIIGMRNKIIHDYLNVDNRIVWDVVTDDLPVLIRALEAVLPPETE